jgi:hypothetical protein
LPEARKASSSSWYCFDFGSACVEANSISSVPGRKNAQVVFPMPFEMRLVSPLARSIT